MAADRKVGSLQDLIDSTPDLVAYLYNDTPGPHSRIRADLNPVPTEFSNWRDEQRAWRETAIRTEAPASPGSSCTSRRSCARQWPRLPTRLPCSS